MITTSQYVVGIQPPARMFGPGGMTGLADPIEATNTSNLLTGIILGFVLAHFLNRSRGW